MERLRKIKRPKKREVKERMKKIKEKLNEIKRPEDIKDRLKKTTNWKN